jgi:hypothetical protein
MTITLEHGVFVLYCDECDDHWDEGFENHEDARDFAKANGWKLRGKPGAWTNVCATCANRGKR